MVLETLLFTVLFAVLGFGISFLFGKFLDVDSDSSAETEGVSPRTDRNGQTVDLIIKDEDLPSDEGTGQYVVGSSHQMLTKDDVRGVSASPAGAQNAYAREQAVTDQVKNDVNVTGDFASGSAGADKEFVPVRNLETLYNVSGKEAVTRDNPAPARDAPQMSDEATYAAEAEELDTLPAMDNLGFESSTPSRGGEEGVNNDTDFATAGSSGGSSRRRSEESAPEVKDAPLLAKAISTILANES